LILTVVPPLLRSRTILKLPWSPFYSSLAFNRLVHVARRRKSVPSCVGHRTRHRVQLASDYAGSSTVESIETDEVFIVPEALALSEPYREI